VFQAACPEPRAVAIGLQPHTPYRATVQASNSEGPGPLSPWSAVIWTAPETPCAPDVPRLINSTLKSIALEWDAPTSDPPAVEYEVRWDTAAAQPQEPLQESASDSPREKSRRYRTGLLGARITGLEPTTNYVFYLRARNSAGWSEWSLPSAVLETTEQWSIEEIKEVLSEKYGGTVASIFRVFDRDGDRMLTQQEFVQGFDSAGLQSVPTEQRLQLFRHAGGEAAANKNGRLTYKDFARIFSMYRATPGLMRGEALGAMPHGRRQEIQEDLHRRTNGSVRSPRLDRAVAHLTSPRSRGDLTLRRTQSALAVSGPRPTTDASTRSSKRPSTGTRSPGPPRGR